jgi:hypothetical protein
VTLSGRPLAVVFVLLALVHRPATAVPTPLLASAVLTLFVAVLAAVVVLAATPVGMPFPRPRLASFPTGRRRRHTCALPNCTGARTRRRTR